MSSKYEVITCPICGDSRYEERNGVYVCKTCDAPFFRVTEEETHKLQEAQNALELYNFTKADMLYANLLGLSTISEKTKAMCYYGRLLAHFGVRYIRDRNGNKVITFSKHDAHKDSIKDTSYYEKLSSNMYGIEYQQQLDKLDREYKHIISELAQNTTYRVFICTKITESTKDDPNNMQKTKDHLMAEQMYKRLTALGLTVFYSEISLSGTKYDAQIYSALMKSDSLLVISSKKEYLESAWVQSEWQRWLHFIDTQRNGKPIKSQNSLFFYKTGDYEVPSILQSTQVKYNEDDIVKLIDNYFKNKTENDIQEKVSKIENYLRKADYDSTYDTINKLINEYPKNYRGYIEFVKFLIFQNVAPNDSRYNEYLKQAMQLADEYTKKEIEDKYKKYLIVEESIEELLITAENSLLFGQIEEAKEKYKEIIRKYSKDYRPWLGLIKILEEEGTESTDKRYKNYLNRALNLCNDNQEKENIKNKYKKYLLETQKEIKTTAGIKEEKPIIQETIIKEELEYELNSDKKSYTVKGIGTCKDKDIIIPNEYKGLPVMRIGHNAFSGCKSLTSIILSNNIVGIDKYILNDCTSLRDIDVGESNKYYKSINGNLYSKDGTKLIQYAIGKKDKTFILPNSVSNIDYSAFSGSTNLIKIEVEENNKYYKSIDGVLYSKDGKTLIRYPICKQNKHFAVPNGVTTIGACAFEDCNYLESIIIPNSVANIEAWVFSNCVNLTVYCETTSKPSGWSSIWIPNNCPVVWGYCEHISSDWIIDKNPTCIGKGHKHKECTKCKKVLEESDIKELGHELVKLKAIEPTCTSVGLSEGTECTRCHLQTEPPRVLPKKEHTYVNGICSKCGDKKYSEGLEYEINSDNTGYILTGIGTCEDTEIIIPSTYEGLPVVRIGYKAFYKCTSLTSITIPSSITNIGEYAFPDCASLTSIEVDENNEYYKSIDGVLYSKDGKTLIRYPEGKKNTTFFIPYGVTSIVDNAFNCCYSLTTIEIPNSVTSIGEGAFYGCTSLEDITIPNSVMSIGVLAFANCISLPVIMIPDSVISIGALAFDNCVNLTIYCEIKKPLFSKPTRWHTEWNPENRPVKWGYIKSN